MNGETEIRWVRLYDKNSDKLYAPKQLLLKMSIKQKTWKYLRDTCRNIGNYWMAQKKELSEKTIKKEFSFIIFHE